MLLREHSPYLTIDEVADLLHLHRDTVRRMLREGRLPGTKVGRAWRIARQALDAYVRGEREKK